MEFDRSHWFRLGCYSAAVAVGLGAFGAHGLKSRISDPYLLDVWSKAVLYHVVHAFGLLAVAQAPVPTPAAGHAFLGGTLLFSGSLYVMTLTNKRWLGAVTPFGGVLFLVGWTLLGWNQR